MQKFTKYIKVHQGRLVNTITSPSCWVFKDQMFFNFSIFLFYSILFLTTIEFFSSKELDDRLESLMDDWFVLMQDLTLPKPFIFFFKSLPVSLSFDMLEYI